MKPVDTGMDDAPVSGSVFRVGTPLSDKVVPLLHFNQSTQSHPKNQRGHAPSNTHTDKYINCSSPQARMRKLSRVRILDPNLSLLYSYCCFKFDFFDGEALARNVVFIARASSQTVETRPKFIQSCISTKSFESMLENIGHSENADTHFTLTNWERNKI